MAGTEEAKKEGGEAVPAAEEKAAIPASESPASDSKALVVFEGEYQSCFAGRSYSTQPRAVWFLQSCSVHFRSRNQFRYSRNFLAV
jgi:hypothetical protein